MEVLKAFDWGMFVVVLCAILLDWLFGFIKAVKQRNIQSTKMFDGIIKKTAYIGVIMVAVLAEVAMHWFQLPITAPLVPAVCVLIIMAEIASILENLIIINPELDKFGLFKLFGVSKNEDVDHDA